MANRVKIDWFENNIWNGKTGEIVWEDPEDSSETSTVVVKIVDFPTEDGFQEVEQNFERRYVKPIEEETEEQELDTTDLEAELSEEPTEEIAEEPTEVTTETVEEEPVKEALGDELECCICHKHFTGHGNNPYPICDEGRCCDECNWNVVIPARIKQLDNRSIPEDIDFEDEDFEECENCREHTSIPDDFE